MAAIDWSTLTMGEVATIESLSGQPISTLENDDAPKGAALAALALIAKRRSGHPKFSWNEAQALTFAEVAEILGTDDKAEPATTEAPAPKAKRSKTSA